MGLIVAPNASSNHKQDILLVPLLMQLDCFTIHDAVYVDNEGDQDTEDETGANELPDENERRLSKEQVQAFIEQWVACRNELSSQVQDLQNFKNQYAEQLANSLYAFPNTSKAQFDATMEAAMGSDMPIAQVIQIREDSVTNLEQEYDNLRAAARVAGLAEADLPLSPHWIDSMNDVSPSQASTLAPNIKNETLDAKRKDIQRYLRRRKRAKEASELLTRWAPTREATQPSPKAFAKLPPLAPEDDKLVFDRPALSPNTVDRQIQRLDAMRRRKRKEMRRQANCPTYHHSP